MSKWEEVSREEWDEDTEAVSPACVNCGAKRRRLWFNGGELDGTTCACGYRYSLEHSTIYLVVERPATPGVFGEEEE